MGKMYRAPKPKRRSYASYAPRDSRGRIMKKVATSVVSKALKVRGLNTVESKYITELNNTGIMQNTTTWAASSNLINPISQSDAHNGRDGYVIQPVYIQVRGMISCSNGVSGLARVLLIRWDDTAVPSMSDIFESPATPTALPNALFNVEKRKHFKVLYDRSFIVSSLADSAGRHYFKINVNCKSHKPVIYTTGAFSESGMSQGRYYVIYMSNIDATNGPLLDFTNRFYYTG